MVTVSVIYFYFFGGVVFPRNVANHHRGASSFFFFYIAGGTELSKGRLSKVRCRAPQAGSRGVLLYNRTRDRCVFLCSVADSAVPGRVLFRSISVSVLYATLTLLLVSQIVRYFVPTSSTVR